MQIQFVRNATLIIRSGKQVILLDPMLAEAGSIPPFALLRHKAVRNPLVPVPESATLALADVTHALITHCQRGHADHLDRKGTRLLASMKVPTFCRKADEQHLRRKSIDARPLVTNERQPFLGGHITPVLARHGHGWIASLMGSGVGYFIELSGEPSLYVAGDTVLTDDVRRVLLDLRPDVAVVAAGNASVDVGAPILMSIEEVMEFTALAPGRVVANHLEALNHCPITRAQVATAAKAAGLCEKLSIPADGDILEFEKGR